jgi:hypothetical protein
MAACLLLVLSLYSPGYAEEDEMQMGWNNKVVAGLNLTQAAFDNWSQGGENTLAWQANLSGSFIRLAERSEWQNSVKLAYGMAKTGDQDARKSVDELRLETAYVLKPGLPVDFYGAVTGETQFAKGYDYGEDTREPISDFVDPGYFTESAGILKSYRGVLQSRLGAAAKQTVANHFAARYSDDPDTPDEVEKVRSEFGLESVTDLTLKVSENLAFDSRLEIFSNLKATNEIDVRWDNLLTAKVAEYVNVTLNVKTFYDRDISTRRQIKQSLALGLSYAIL